MGDPGPVSAAPTAADLRDRYLDLVERALLNTIHGGPRIEVALRGAAMRLRHPWQTRCVAALLAGQGPHDALTNLYDGVAPGGYVVIDDYGILGACRRAVHDFLDGRGLAPRIEPIDGPGVCWRKE